MSEQKIVRTICTTLQHYSALHSKCASDLIRLIEELAKYSISPAELKILFWLLRTDANFDYRKQLLHSVASIALYSLANSTVCSEFLDIQVAANGITVPDIRKWITSGSYGFVFHGWIRLDNSTTQASGSDETKNSRRIILR